MAFFGKPSAQLSPIFFRGDIFAKGVNIIIHNDVTQSMNVYQYGSENYTNITEYEPLASGLSDVEENSIFYDGLFVRELQSTLISTGVGVDDTESPNIYSYIDADIRQNASVTFTITQGGETSTYDRFFLRGAAALDSVTWNGYIKNKPQIFDDTNPTSYAFRVIDPGITDINSLDINTDINLRLSGIDISNYKYTEDVQGFLASLFYLTENTINPVNQRIQIGEGGIFARNILADKFRKNNKTYVITASNEQENSGPDLVGFGISTTDNVRVNSGGQQQPEYNRNEYGSSGLYVQRYWHYFLDNGISDYGGRNYVGLGGGDSTVFVNSISSNSQIRERIRLRYNPLTFNSNSFTLTDSSTVNLRTVFSGSNQSSLFTNVYNLDKSAESGTLNVNDYWNPNSTAYVPLLTGNDVTEEFGRYFDLVALKWPTGNAERSLAGDGGNVPTSLNPADPTALANYITSQGDGEWSNDLVNSPGIQYKDQDDNLVTLLNPSGNDTSDGIITQIKELRSEIDNYSIMIYGYFVPQKSEVHTFRLDSYEISFLWFGEGAVSRDPTTGISNWTGTSANASSFGTGSERELISNNYYPSQFLESVGGDSREFITPTSLTAGKYYPIRILMGNRGDWISDSPIAARNDWENAENNFRQGTSTATGFNDPDNPGSTNPSALTFKFKAASDPSFRTDGRGFFFGGNLVSQVGSEFNPSPATRTIRTLTQELNKRNVSVVSFSGYKSPETSITKNYDGVFFPSPTVYQYVRFTSETEFESVILPTAPDWVFDNYFDDVPYLLTSPELQVVNTETNDVTGTGLELSINRNNSEYNITISNPGDGYKIGDRFFVSSADLGQPSAPVGQPVTELTVEVDSVQAVIETNITADNIVEGDDLGSGATFTIIKTTGSGGSRTVNYNVNKINSGTNYQVGDRLTISGSLLDGSTVNTITIEVDSISGGGATGPIDAFSIISGTPTGFIRYGKDSSWETPGGLSATYKPKNIVSIQYETFGIQDIGYEHSDVQGIAYTTISDSQIVSIGYSAYSVENIGYAVTAPVISIGFTAPTITAIGYSSPDIVSIGYTYGNITSISYQQKKQISGIGYTTPSIVSIGHTFVVINEVRWPESAIRLIGIATQPGGSGGNAQFSLSDSEVAAGKTLGLAEGDIIVFDGTTPAFGETTNLSRTFDQEEFTVTDVLNEYTFEINSFTSGGSDIDQVFPLPGGSNPTGYICISKPDTDTDNFAGLSSSIQFTSVTDHPFIIGDRVISYGSTDAFNGTEFVVDSTPSSTVFTLAGTGIATAFTTGFSTYVSPGNTRTGYYNSTLQIQFATQTRSVGIASISYYLLDDNLVEKVGAGGFDPNRNYFTQVRDTGGLFFGGSTIRRVRLRNDLIDISNDGFNDPNSPFVPGDEIYVFNISANGGPNGIEFGSVGYAHTIQQVQSRELEIYVNTASFADFTNNIREIYVIKKGSVPFVETTSPHRLKDGQIILIQGNENDVYNTTFKVGNVGTGVSFTLSDFNTGSVLTTEEILTVVGNDTCSNGNVLVVELVDSNGVDVGDGDVIDTFGNTVYNLTDATLTAIGNTDSYRFNISNPTYPIDGPPSEFANGISGNAGIQNISGILTTSISHGFGLPGDNIAVKVYNTSSGFDKDYLNAIVISSNEIYLGSESEDPTSFYTPVESAYTPDLTGNVFLLGSSATITIGITEQFADLGFKNSTQVDIQNSGQAFFNDTVVINNIVGNTAEITGGLGDPTDPDITASAGQLGLRNSPATVTISFSKTLQELGIGDPGDEVLVDIQGTTSFNGDNQTVTIYGPNTFGINASTNPADYLTSETDGRIGYKSMPGIGTITGGDLVELGFGNIGDDVAVKIENTSLFDNSNSQQIIRIYSDTEFGLLSFDDPVDHTDNYAGSTGILGLEDAPPTVTILGNLFTLGFGAAVGDVFNSRLLYTDVTQFNGNNNNCLITSSNTFLLTGNENPVNASGESYGDSYTNVGDPTPSVVALRGTNLKLTTSSDHEFKIDDIIEFQNTNDNLGGDFDTTYTVISVLSSTEVLLDLVLSNTAQIRSSTTGIAGLRDFPATVKLNIDIPERIIDGSGVKFENTGVPAFDGDKIVSNFDFQRRLFTITGTDNPVAFDVSSTSSPNRIIGLREVPTVTTTADHGLDDTSSVTIYGADDVNGIGFNQQFTQIKVYSPTTFGIISPDLSQPSTFVGTNAGTNGVVGVDNKNIIVNTTSTHPFVTGDSIKIVDSVISDSGITGSGAEDFNGTYTITVETSTRFRLDSTSLVNAPSADTTYDDVANGGYFVGVNSDAKVQVNAHNYPDGSSVEIDNTSLSFLNGDTFTITVIDANNFYLESTNLPPGNDYTVTSGAVGIATLISGAGSGARFTVRRQFTSGDIGRYQGITTAYSSDFSEATFTQDGEPANVLWYSPGSGYRVDDILTIPGNLLGGTVPQNDCDFRVAKVSQNTSTLLPDYRPGPSGQIVALGAGTGDGNANGNTADGSLDYSDSSENLIIFNSQAVAGTGVDALFTVTRDGSPDYTIAIANGGSGYIVNDVLRITGDKVGGTNPENNIDITILPDGVNASGSIINSASSISVVGIASLSNPVSTINKISGEPLGLEETGSNLSQTHNMLSISQNTEGGLFKIEKIYRRGSFEKYINPEIIYWPAVHNHNYPDQPKGSLFFDTFGATGIATIILDDDADNQAFVDFKLGDEVMVFGTGSEYVDFDKVGYALTVVGIETSTENETWGPGPGNNANYNPDARDVYQYLSFETSMKRTDNDNWEVQIVNYTVIDAGDQSFDNTEATDFKNQFGASSIDQILRTDIRSPANLSPNKRGFNGAVINANVDARVYAPGHGFNDGDVVTVVASTNSGLAKSDYVVRLEPYLLKNLYTDIDQDSSSTGPYTEANIVTELNVGGANHFRLEGFTPNKFMASQQYDLTQAPDGTNPPDGPVQFIIEGGNDNLSSIWNPNIGNSEVEDDSFAQSIEARLGKALIAYNPFDESKPGIYVGISTLDNRVAAAKAIADFISKNP